MTAKEESLDGYLYRVSDIFESAYNDGYAEGFAKAKEEYGQTRGIAHCYKARQEETEKYGIELWGWCECKKPIIGRWAGLANFCPWCGKVIEWKDPEKNEQKA